MGKAGMRWDAAQLREYENRRTGATPARVRKLETESERSAWAMLSPLGFVREHHFNPMRRWRFDFANLDLKIAVEIEGGVHRLSDRFAGDLSKYNAAALDGWLLLRFSPAQVMGDEAGATIWHAMTIRKAAGFPREGNDDGKAKSETESR